MNSRFLRAALAVALVASLARSQSNTPWRDGLDDPVYFVGLDPTQPPIMGWEQWALQPNQGAAISADVAQSGPHSFFIGGNTDVVQRFNQGTGKWVVGASVYVPTVGPKSLQKEAYFILLNTYSPQGPNSWSLQLLFDPVMAEVRFAGGINSGLAVPMLVDQWSDIRVELDLDADTAQVFYGRTGIAEAFGAPFVWSTGVSASGVSELAALDLFANDQFAGPNPLGGMYFDDLFVEAQVPPADWNRRVDDLSFAPGSGPGLVDVTISCAIGADTCNIETDLGFEVQMFVDGVPTGPRIVTPFCVREVQSDCGSNQCDPGCFSTPCATMQSQPDFLNGTCEEDYSQGTCVCRCSAIVEADVPNFPIPEGSAVTATLMASPGALRETWVADDSLTEVYAGLCAGVTYCVAKPGLVCGLPAISAVGYASATASTGFLISASPARSNKTGILLYSNLGRALIPFPAGGHVLCVPAQGLRRAGPTNSGGAAPCDGVFSVDMNEFASGTWVPPGGGPSYNPAPYLLVPGGVIDCQFWGRDSQGTGSFMSDALEYLVCP